MTEEKINKKYDWFVLLLFWLGLGIWIALGLEVWVVLVIALGLVLGLWFNEEFDKE